MQRHTRLTRDAGLVLPIAEAIQLHGVEAQELPRCRSHPAPRVGRQLLRVLHQVLEALLGKSSGHRQRERVALSIEAQSTLCPNLLWQLTPGLEPVLSPGPSGSEIAGCRKVEATSLGCLLAFSAVGMKAALRDLDRPAPLKVQRQ